MILKLLLILQIFGLAPLCSSISIRDESPNKAEVCDTELCVRVRNQIRLTMNLSADPCEDFYEFACGGSEIFVAKRAAELMNQRTVDIVMEAQDCDDGCSSSMKRIMKLSRSCELDSEYLRHLILEFSNITF